MEQQEILIYFAFILEILFKRTLSESFSLYDVYKNFFFSLKTTNIGHNWIFILYLNIIYDEI